MGYCPNVQPLVKQCDFGVLPSTKPEALGLSNLEYMMLGKAHVTTNNGAQLEYLTNGENALLVDPENQFQLADAIKQLIENPELRNKIGTQAQNDYDHHLGYDSFYAQMTALYHSLF